MEEHMIQTRLNFSLVTFSMNVTQCPSSRVSLLHALSNMINVILACDSHKDGKPLADFLYAWEMCSLPLPFTLGFHEPSPGNAVERAVDQELKGPNPSQHFLAM